jgi:hypothetical protein
MPTPIEMMIDRACGIIPGSGPGTVILRCPKCNREKRVLKDKSDPAETYIIEATCDKCESPGFDEVIYFDEIGRQIFDF